MKILSGTLLLIALCRGQSYSITIMGMHAAQVEQTIHDSGRIEYKTKNQGLFDIIWPTKNTYETTFDSISFAVKSWKKNIEQGEFTQESSTKKDSHGILVYDEKTKIKIKESTQTIFTALAMVQFKDSEELDTKWFPFEHEGATGEIRFNWADSSNIWAGEDSLMCDHYRMDIDLSNASEVLTEESDYFLNEIVSDGVVRELWVSRIHPKRIIIATFKTAWFSVTATRNE